MTDIGRRGTKEQKISYWHKANVNHETGQQNHVGDSCGSGTFIGGKLESCKKHGHCTVHACQSKNVKGNKFGVIREKPIPVLRFF